MRAQEIEEKAKTSAEEVLRAEMDELKKEMNRVQGRQETEVNRKINKLEAEKADLNSRLIAMQVCMTQRTLNVWGGGMLSFVSKNFLFHATH